MKKQFLCVLLFSLFLMIGCQTDSPSFPDTGDSSRAVYFSETHSLHHQHPDALCSVTVEQVLEHRYQNMGYDSLVFLATVEEVFGASTAPWFHAGETITVWVFIDDLRPYTDQPAEELEAAVDTLRQIIDSSDSLILYGTYSEVTIAKDSPEHDLWLADTHGSSPQYIWDSGECQLDLPPALRITGLRGWELLPVCGGVLDAAPLENLLLSLDSEMAFSLDNSLPQGGQYFQNGDSAEDLYAAMRYYVKEYSRSSKFK